MPMLKKKCQVKHESLRIRQAQHRNRAEEAHLDHVRKFINQERMRHSDDIERARKTVQKTIKQTLQSIPVPAKSLVAFHDYQRLRCHDVAMHVVHCYLLKQERNKQLWASQRSEKGDKSMSEERPVKTPDHLEFIIKAFPDILRTSVPREWQHDPTLVDIYSHGRANHDLKCMSTRATPVGGYPTRGPINFRLWDPDKPVKLNTDSKLAARRKKKTHTRNPSDGSSQGKDEMQPIALPLMDLITGNPT